MNEISIYTVDAFTSAPFTGNPAAVCLLEDDISDNLKQKIAAEMNISETAFVTKAKGSDFSSDSNFSLRWFTPSTEVPLCGHATLAAATVIYRVAGNTNQLISFSTKSGILTAEKDGDMIVLDLPSNPPEEVIVEEYTDLIHLVAGHLPVKQCYLSKHTKKLLVRLEDEVRREDLEKISPDIDSILKLDQDTVKGVILTVKGRDEYDFLSRYFAPWVGIPEDPVTGSAHTVLTPYWAQILNKTKMFSRQCSPRGGDLKLNLVEPRVRVAGNSVVVLSGTLRIK